MAKAWVWIIVAIFAIVTAIWLIDYNYRYGGMCRDDRGNYYSCQKTNSYSNQGSYSYYDNYGNRVVVERDYRNYDDDNYYNCHYYFMPDSRYGELLRNSAYNCDNYYYGEEYNKYIDYYTVKTVTVEKPPIIYVN